MTYFLIALSSLTSWGTNRLVEMPPIAVQPYLDGSRVHNRSIDIWLFIVRPKASMMVSAVMIFFSLCVIAINCSVVLLDVEGGEGGGSSSGGVPPSFYLENTTLSLNNVSAIQKKHSTSWSVALITTIYLYGPINHPIFVYNRTIKIHQNEGKE